MRDSLSQYPTFNIGAFEDLLEQCGFWVVAVELIAHGANFRLLGGHSVTVYQTGKWQASGPPVLAERLEAWSQG